VNADPSIRLKRLVIEQLFGAGSSTIDIPFKLDERVTVLHGRNGSGKTITLGLLAALRSGNLTEFVRYPFKSFRLDLTDNTSLVVERIPSKRDKQEHKDPKNQKPARPSLRFEWSSSDGTQTETLDIDARRLAIKSPALRALLERLPQVKFIKADRLFIREPNGDTEELRRQRGYGLMVERLSQDIRALVVQADRQYRRISTRLDASLANRLFEHHKDIPDLVEMKQRSRDLREQAERLKNLGLLQEDPGSLDEERLSDEQKGTFFIILKDREAKLAPFAQVVDKAERLLSSLNRKLAPKSVRLDVEKGYQVLTAAGEPLALEDLSSGEQHEIVLLHELLFDVRPGSLILIDEPELSLHVTWQVDVLPDLLEIAKLSDLDFVLATHSPYITRDHDDLLVRLGEPV